MTETGGKPIISLSGVAVRRQNFTLGPLHIDIPSGMVTAIVGPNGSGKSTLFRLLMQMEPYDEGEVRLFGEQVVVGAEEKHKQRLGFLSELPHAYENRLTGQGKAQFAASWYTDWSWERYDKLIKSFDAEPNLKLGKISKGMRRKVEFAIAMALNPELLLLDEPSSGLDPFAWKTMLAELQRYMDQGDRTLVFASHITEEVRRLADYVLFMHRGKSLGLYEKDELFDTWRTLVVQISSAGSRGAAAIQRALHELPGFQGLSEAGPGIYRLETNRSEEAEAYCKSNGYSLLSSGRMELEEILACLVRKGEERR